MDAENCSVGVDWNWLHKIPTLVVNSDLRILNTLRLAVCQSYMS